jgi:hypothetical protein
VALSEKRRFLYNHSGDFPQVILIIPSHVPNNFAKIFSNKCFLLCSYVDLLPKLDKTVIFIFTNCVYMKLYFCPFIKSKQDVQCAQNPHDSIKNFKLNPFFTAQDKRVWNTNIPVCSFEKPFM